MVGRVIPNAPNPPASTGGIGICRPTNTHVVGRVIPNAPNPHRQSGVATNASPVTYSNPGWIFSSPSGVSPKTFCSFGQR